MAGAHKAEEPRGRQLLAGACIILGVGAMFCCVLLGWSHFPGLAGETAGTIVGVMTTPIFMEASFACIGLGTVLILNGWRRHLAGDEFVEVEVPDENKEAADSHPDASVP